MRRLHAVSPRERFIGRGAYRRHQDDKVVEQWTLHQLGAGAEAGFLIRIDRDDEDGFRLYEALIGTDGLPVRFNEEAFRRGQARTRVHRWFAEGRMQTTHSRGEEDVLYDECSLPGDAVPVDWPLIVQGMAIQAALRRAGCVFRVADRAVLAIERVNIRGDLIIVSVEGRCFWLNARGITLAAHIATDEKYYLDDGSSKSIDVCDC